MGAGSRLGSDGPHKQVLTHRFDDLGDKTKLTMRVEHPSAEERRKHEASEVEGWSSNFDSLDDHLAAIVLTG